MFPFHLLLIPVTIWYRSEMEKHRRLKQKVAPGSKATLMDVEREKLILKLCERYRRSLAAFDSKGCSYDDYIHMNDDRRRGSYNFAEAIALQRHNSFMWIARNKNANKLSSARSHPGDMVDGRLPSFAVRSPRSADNAARLVVESPIRDTENRQGNTGRSGSRGSAGRVAFELGSPDIVENERSSGAWP